MSSIASVSHSHIFGLKGDVSSALNYIDETTVLYPAGANSILYNTETKIQRFIPVSDRTCDGITSMCVSANKRYAAIGERGSDKPNCVIYDLTSLRKRKSLSPTDVESKEFVSMAFSSDAKYIITQAGAPDWTLYYWSWEKSKIMASTRTSNNSTDRNNALAAQQIAGGPSANSGPLNAGTAVASSGATSAVTTANANGKEGIGNTVYQVSFNPNDSTQVCVVGNGIFKCLRYQEGLLKPMPFPKMEARNFLCHCWTNDGQIIVGTEDARILVFESHGEFKGEIQHTYNNVPRSVQVLVSYSKGFISGASGGNVVIYERTEDTLSNTATGSNTNTAQAGASNVGVKAADSYKKAKEFALSDETSKVTNMALSPTEDNMICSLDNNQIFSIALGDDIKYELFAQPFHHGQITGMDTCIRKPLIVTCSSDRSVRVWNYLEMTCELVKYFPEEAFSVAIHPSGLYILVGFSDKVRLMNLLIDDIRPFREFTIRGCRECRFSNGGQYFAAVHGNTIQIYSTWNFENLGNLKGHNGKVRSIHWTADDSNIITAGMDGAVYDWALKNLGKPGANGTGGNGGNSNASGNSGGGGGGGIKREGESILKSCSYTCAVATPDGKAIYAVGSDKTLKEIIDSQIVREVESDTVLTQLALSHSGRMMFVGTSTGTIRAMRFPLGPSQPHPANNGTANNNAANVTAAANAQPHTESTEPGAATFQEHQAHSKPVTKLSVSYDDQYLFSTSEDGCLMIFKIADKEGKAAKRDRDIVYADEILVTKSDLEEKNALMAELKTRVEELKMENEYQLRLKDMNFSEKIKEVTEKFMQEIEALKITSTVLKTDKEKEEVRHAEEMNEEKDRHSREMMELESIHSSKLMAEYEKYQELQSRNLELQQQWERQMRGMQNAKEKALNELTSHFETKLREKQMEIDQLQETIQNQQREFEETTRETEEDADTEILELKHRYEKKLKDEREVGLRLKGENGIMRKKFNTLQAEIEAHKAEISKMYAEEKKLHGVIKSLEKDIVGLKKEIHERDETIQDKEKRIYDLKKKNQELEKFKFVLDYKIKELKRQIEPREQDIQGMTSQIKEMDLELEHYHKTNAQLELAIADLKLKLKAAEREVQKEHETYQACIALVRRFKVDLNECVQFIQEPKLLKVRNIAMPEGVTSQREMCYVLTLLSLLLSRIKNHIKKLYQKYCKESVNDSDTIEVDVNQEYARQREYLERTVTSLRHKVAKAQTVHRTDNMRIMQENVALIREINQLRRDLKNVKPQDKVGGEHGKFEGDGTFCLCFDT
ncbi:Cilia- and flagella-associated protein 57 [Quaeritorhiza haematococci]|nr:Cilia- and flagella-associated protein 57 [Quaeritorhiza haematococci]